MQYQTKTYRQHIDAQGLTRFEVIEKESDLLVMADKNLYDKVLAHLLKYRTEIEAYIRNDPEFKSVQKPRRVRFDAPRIVKDIQRASRKAKVGPIAAVAGAITEFVGKDLAPLSDELIIENNGNIFLKINQPRKYAIFTGNPIALEIEPAQESFGICSSSSGNADAVIVIAKSCSLADAAARSIALEAADIEKALKKAKKIRGLDGVLIIKDDQIGALGKINLIPA